MTKASTWLAWCVAIGITAPGCLQRNSKWLGVDETGSTGPDGATGGTTAGTSTTGTTGPGGSGGPTCEELVDNGVATQPEMLPDLSAQATSITVPRGIGGDDVLDHYEFVLDIAFDGMVGVNVAVASPMALTPEVCISADCPSDMPPITCFNSMMLGQQCCDRNSATIRFMCPQTPGELRIRIGPDPEVPLPAICTEYQLTYSF